MTQSAGSWKVAEVSGVQLKLHFTLIFVMIYVMMIAALQFPQVVHRSGIQSTSLILGPWVSGALFAVGLFVSIAIHEFGHVWVAKLQGVKVRSVTLMMLGGVSEMDKLPNRPLAEFKLAIIGPVVSLLLSAIAWMIYWVCLRTDLILNPIVSEIGLMAYWLAGTNLILGIFNLIPAFPLDGGRALRSLLATFQGKLKATHSAVRVSRVFSWIFGIWGIWSFNLLLILIAFFIYGSAEAEYAMHITEGILDGLKVSDVMKKMSPILGGDSLSQAAEEMVSSRSNVLPVDSAEGQSAILSLEDLQKISRDVWHSTQVSEVMEPVASVPNVNDPIIRVLSDIASTSMRALPVMDQGRVVGIIKYSDISELAQFRSIEQRADKAA